MKAYVVTNQMYFAGRSYSYNYDDLHWCVIWANDAKDILDLYKESYDNAMLDFGDELKLEDLAITDVSAKVSIEPEQETPYWERRILVEREAGFRIPGESYCENCEMASNGLNEYLVCSECYLCKECRRWVNETEEVCPECLPYLDQ